MWAHCDKLLLPGDSKVSSAFRYSPWERPASQKERSFSWREKMGGRWPFEGSHAKHKTLRTASSLDADSRSCTAQQSLPHCVSPCASGPQGLRRVQGTPPQEKYHSHAMGLGSSPARWYNPCLHAGQHSSFPVMQSSAWMRPLLWDLTPWKRRKQKQLA